MGLVTIRFDRVFDIARPTPFERGDHTTFSFDSASGTTYGVTIPGTPRLESGMTVTAFLSRDNDWQSLVGWRDHASGDIVTVSDGPYILALIVCPILAAGLLLRGSLRDMASHLFVIGVVASFALFKTARISKVRNALMQTGDA